MKTLIVKEFEPIFKEKYGNEKYLSKELFEELEKFIGENSGEDSEECLSDFLRISSKAGRKLIKPRNYVGVINIKNKLQIEILPKIDIEGDKNYNKLKQFFLRMLASLQEFNYKQFQKAQLQVSKLPLYEIFIYMYLEEVRYLSKRGLKSDYVAFENSIPYFKGKLLVNQHLRDNLVRKDRFFMQFNEFNVDCPENKLIKATLQKLQRVSTSSKNQITIRQTLANFEMVPTSDHYEKDFSQVKIDRNSQIYQTLMSWSKVFLFGKSFSTFKGNQNVTAILFPMEKIFESYIAKMMKEHLEDWKVESQKASKYLFDEPKKFRLKPDLYLQSLVKNKKIVADTKWKRLNSNVHKNYGISQADMYQMYAYAYKYDVSDIVMIYPLHDNGFSNRIFFKQLEKYNKSLKGISVTINLIDVSKDDNHVKQQLQDIFSGYNEN